MQQDNPGRAGGFLGRVLCLLGAAVMGTFGVSTMWSGVNALSVFLFAAALVLVVAAFTGGGGLGMETVGLTDLLVVAVMGYAGANLIAFAARQFQASRRLTNPGDDFVIEGVLAAGGLAAMVVPILILVRRARRSARD